MATEARDGPGTEGRSTPSVPEGAPHPPITYAQSPEHWATEDSSQALIPSGICPAGFWTGWEWGLLYSLQFPPSAVGTSTLCLSHQCILETGNWISRSRACKWPQGAVMTILGRDEWNRDSLQALRQAVVSQK